MRGKSKSSLYKTGRREWQDLRRKQDILKKRYSPWTDVLKMSNVNEKSNLMSKLRFSNPQKSLAKADLKS